MRSLLVCLITGFILAGCATTAGFEKRAASFNGKTEVDLIRTLGVPQQSYETGEKKFLTYSTSRFVMVPTAHGNLGNTLSCQITFEIDRGVVVGSSWRGNDCQA